MKYVDEFLEYLKVIKKHSGKTIDSYRGDIKLFLEFNQGSILIDKDIVNSYMLYLNEKNESKKSISRKLSSLRGFYNYLEKKKIIKENYFNSIKNPKIEKSLPKLVKDDDIEKMFNIPDIRKEFGQRNLLIIRMLYATGVRVSELVNIKIKDINMSEKSIRILGKGSKERIVLFGNKTMDILENYLNRGRRELDTNGSDYLFLNKDGNKISTRYIRKIIDDIITKGSISMHISPHMLRHTFATEMLNNGCDLVSVKDLLGHESLATTSIYTHVSNEKIKEIYKKAHPRA